MKKLYSRFKTTLILALFLCVKTGFSQNVGINSTGNPPASSAGLDVDFSDKGLLIPRVTLTGTNSSSPISSPTESLLVYNTVSVSDVTPGYYYWNGSAWVRLATGTGSQWSTNGSDVSYTTGSVNVGTSTSDASAVLNASSSSKGILIPQVTLSSTSSASPVSNPTISLLVFNTATANDVTPGYYYWYNNAWNRLTASGSSSSSQWTTSGTNIYNNNTGNVGIGSSSFNGTAAEKLLVDAGTTSSYNLISAKGTINNYLQLNIQNKSNGTSASSDIVATNDTGNETTNYVDLGINSSANASGLWGGPTDAYLYNLGEDFLIGTGTSGKSLKFLTGGSSETSNTRMMINGTGNVGIGTSNPSYKLSVNGTNPLYLGGVQTGAATDSLLTLSGGLVKKVLPGSTVWALGGNTLSTTPGEQNFGTTNGYDLPFIVNNTERMRITTEGRVGIGTSVTDSSTITVDAGVTTLPSVLDLSGDKNGYLQFNITNQNNGNFASTDIVATANNGTEESAYIDMGINSAGYSTGGNAILNGANTAYLYANAGKMYIGNAAMDQPLVFFTNFSNKASDEDARGQERMRITTSGSVLIGTASTADTASYKFYVNGSAKATAWATTSDRRLKTNIRTLSYGLKEISALQPVSYNWKDPKQTRQLQLGLIAQDAKKVIPEIVTGDEDKEMLGINYTELVPVLINAIKEQQKQIEELKKKVEILEKK